MSEGTVLGVEEKIDDAMKNGTRLVALIFGAAFVLGIGNAIINQFVSIPIQDWSWVRDWERTRWLPPGWIPEHRFTCVGIYEPKTGERKNVCQNL